MWHDLIREKEGRFLMIGIGFALVGFLTMVHFPTLSAFTFYGSILFSGYFATQNAIVDTIQEKSPNVDLLMVLSALGSCLIGYESEGAMLLIIFAAAEVLEEYATNKSTQAISELMDQVPERAHRLLANGEVEEVLTEHLQLKDKVLVQKGEQVPIDGWLLEEGELNESSLTGEAIPMSKIAGDDVFAGTINVGNAFMLEVSKLSHETMFSQIIRMVEEAQTRPSKISRTIKRFEKHYVIGVLISVPLFILALYGMGYSFTEAFYRGMVLLTVASPCALVASATPASLSAISNGAKKGVLFKGGAAIESLATLETLFVDKTGTLTYGMFEVIDYEVSDAILPEVVYMEQQSSHPIAEAIVRHFRDLDLSQINSQEKVVETSGSGLQMGQLMIGKPSLFQEMADPNQLLMHLNESHTTVIIAKNQTVVGRITLADQVRKEAKQAISNFQEEQVKVVLLTGDHSGVAAAVASDVGIIEYQADCLPEDKIRAVQDAQEHEQVVAMIGDGINDAPALAHANLGIAMGSGTSVAMESGDIVIVKNDLAKLFESFQLSQKLNRIIKQNILFAVGVIILLVCLNLIGLLDLPRGVIFHEGSTILVILNGLRLLKAN